MVKANSSRLKETNFSDHNLRKSYINSQVEYLASLRDSVIFDNYGIKVLVRVPVTEFGDILSNNVDEYSNFVNENWIETTETVVPLFDEYRQVLSEAGMTADGTDGITCLQISIPSKLYLPRDSRIVFNEYDCNEQGISREWVVLGTVMKQLSGSKTYSRIANCVPSRQVLVNQASTYEGEFYFSSSVDRVPLITSDIRALGEFFFVNNTIESINIFDSTDESGYDESDSGETVIESAKKITPYQMDAVFTAKRISISVLN